MANINLGDLTKQWDSLDYAQQQAKLKANAGLQGALDKLGISVKSAPTTTPTSTQQASNNAKVGTGAVAGINQQPTINAGTTTQYKTNDYRYDQSINPKYADNSSTQYSTQNPKYTNTNAQYSTQNPKYASSTNAQYSTQNPKYTGVSSQNPKYTAPNNQYSTQNPKYTTNTPTTTTNTSKNNNGNGSTYGYVSPKQQQRDYQDNSQARMNQIADNLDRYKITNPELFKDYDSFYNFFIDGKGRSADQIKFLDNWYANYKQNEKYNNMTPEEVGNGIANGTVPEDYINTASSTDPDRANAIKTALKDAQDGIANEGYLSELAGLSGFQAWNRKEMLYRDANNDGLDDRLYHEPTEEEKKLVNENSELEAERLKLSNAMKDLQSDLTNQYPDADLSTIMLLTSDRGNKIQKSLDTLNVTQTKVQGTLKYLQTERETMDKAGLNTISELQKNYGIYMEYSPEGIKERTKAEYEATHITLDQADNGTEAQKQMALQNVLDGYYDKYGDIIQRSEQQVINDVIAEAKRTGKTLSQALEDNFLKYLREKPGFKQLNTISRDPYVVKVGDAAYKYDAATDTFSLITGNGTAGTSGVTGTGVAGSQWGNGNQVKLGEEAVDTGIKNVYGSNVKLAPTVGNMLQEAVNTLKSQGIDLQIGDSYRSYETQKRAYEEDQAKPVNQRKGVAAPGNSFHEIGQAIDIAQSQMNDPKVIQALLDAGFTRPVSSEKWHWSYGEGKDAFGGVSNKSKAVLTPSPESGVSGYTSNGTPINAGGWISDLEDKFTNGFSDKDDRKETYAAYGITPDEYNAMKRAYGVWYADNNWQQEMQDKLALLLEMYDWETGVNDGLGSYHQGAWNRSSTGDGWDWISDVFSTTKAQQGKAIYDKFMNNETLNKFLDLKKNGATFGAMSDSEWKIIGDSVSKLKWESTRDTFQTELRNQINDYIKALTKKGVSIPEYTLKYGGEYPDAYAGGTNSLIDDLM